MAATAAASGSAEPPGAAGDPTRGPLPCWRLGRMGLHCIGGKLAAGRCSEPVGEALSGADTS
jgi:hypothetical protein